MLNIHDLQRWYLGILDDEKIKIKRQKTMMKGHDRAPREVPVSAATISGGAGCSHGVVELISP